jgi:hypothetical protein
VAALVLTDSLILTRAIRLRQSATLLLARWRTSSGQEGHEKMTTRMKSVYRNGVVLTLEELAVEPCHFGNLVLENDMEGGRISRRAWLVDATSPECLRDMAPPLFNVEVVNMAESYMKVCGDQFDTVSGIRFHHKQCWFLHTIKDK